MEDTLNTLRQAIIMGSIPDIIENGIRYALQKGASDIHIEPQKNVIQIRIRVDGLLRIIVEYPLNLHPGVVSKVKIMSNLKIDESRVPQDGRITTFIGETEVDLRTSTLPTPNGEKIVMRVVDKSKVIPKLSALGLKGKNYRLFEAAIQQPNGIILTTGPTGSGKTTTMYSALAVLNSPEKNIMTFEDPIENQMDGLNQSQIRSDIGYTFANGLRTALRQDPDIIMVGEIRDKETIDIAIEASLTGHLVVSTIHTNSATETITRILNMHVPDFLMTASINLIMAQRLVRRLCDNCKTPMQPSPDAKKRINEAFAIFKPDPDFDMSILNNQLFYAPKPGGCPHCEGLAYKGRLGIFEVMDFSEPIKKAILSDMPSFEIEKIAKQQGMITLEQDGLVKALQGLTSLEEIYKIIKN